MSEPRAATTWPAPTAADERWGMALGFFSVCLFALTIPMTRMATGSTEQPGLPSLFVAVGRPALAGTLAALHLWLSGARWPRGQEWTIIALAVLGGTVGWTGLLAMAVRHVDAIHASVVSGMIPLATAVIAARWERQRPSWGFWACALGTTALVLAFMGWRGSGHWHWADGLLLLAILGCALGYVAGAQLSKTMSTVEARNWTAAVSTPVALPLALMLLPAEGLSQVPVSAWVGFVYVAVVSAWLGMFVWFRALHLGGAVRVSQTQAIQPFLSMLLAVPLLGERLDLATAFFGLAVMGLVWLGRRMPVHAAARGATVTQRPSTE